MNGKWLQIGTLVIALTAVSTGWGITLAKLDAATKAIEQLTSVVAALDHRVADHERLPVHPGAAESIKMIVAEMEDVHARLRVLEAERRGGHP